MLNSVVEFSWMLISKTVKFSLSLKEQRIIVPSITWLGLDFLRRVPFAPTVFNNVHC